MTDEKIQRINALARKSKAEGLTPEEKEEQQALRREYLDEIRADLIRTQDNTCIVDKKGNKTPLRRQVPLS